MTQLKEKLHAGQRLVGTHVVLNDPCITEIVANLAFDFIWIDTEHSAIDYHMLQLHLMAAKAGGTPAIVRVPANPILVKRVLEQRPQGIVLSMANSVKKVSSALASCRDWPDGAPGFGPLRAIRGNLDKANEGIVRGQQALLRLVQVESEQAIGNLPELLEDPCVDGIIIGASDLSGERGERNHVYGMKTLALIDRAVREANKKQVPIGISTGATDEDALKFWADRGMQIISAGMDFDFILRGAQKTLATLRAL